MSKTSISAGLAVRHVLTTDAAVAAITTNVFPVATDTATLPYIAYRRSGMATTASKSAAPAADKVEVEVTCYAATYDGSVTLAEAVRAALEYKQVTTNGITMRSCVLVGGSEDWEADAYAQRLVFEVRI